jgi:hypothetical protein
MSLSEKMAHDLAAKMADDALIAFHRTASLVHPEDRNTLVALTLQYLVGTFSVHAGMSDEFFDVWVTLMRDARARTCKLRRGES